MSSLQKQVLKNKLPPMPSRGLGNTGFGGRKIGRRRDYTPVTWDSYFETYKDVELPDKSTFRIYFSGKEGPLLLLLHGGGYSGLSWSLLSASISQLVECQIAAIDLRGHGETASSDDDNLSADTLSSDIGDVFKALYGDDDPPPVILVGHSMGGAIAVHAVYRNLLPTAIGLVVIDVVEGTALDALQSMQSFLRSRPSSFSSLQHAIEWCVRSGQVRNVESARVSMPGQLKNSTTNLPATHELQQQSDNNSSQAAATDMSFPRPFHSGTAAADSILEEAEDDEDQRNNDSEDDERNTKKVRSGESLQSETSATEKDQFKPPVQPVSSMPKYIWRIDLAKTEKFWTGWFEGLSNMFLSTSIPKLLLLAGVDRLDKDLTIGQMQGKFQMQVLPQCGHAVHEDVPDKVAEAIATFMVRHKFTNPTCDFQKPFCAC